MKVLVISDSHGQANQLRQIITQVAADHVIHCGDFCTDYQELPPVSLTVVKGNCDWAKVPSEELWEQAGIRFFVTHGHDYRVKETLLPIRYRAEEIGAQIVCFGHSHLPVCEQTERILTINPGSITQPRGFPVPTYAVVEMGSVSVEYYQPDGRNVEQLGGLFYL